MTTRDPFSNPHDVGLPPSKLPINVQRIGVVLFALGFVAASFFSITEHWRRAAFTLGASLILLSILRLTCDSKVLGILAVRSRRFDSIYTAILGSIMVFLAVSVDALGS